MVAQKSSAIRQIVIKTSIIMAIVSLAVFYVLYYFTSKEIELRQTKEINSITEVVKNGIQTTSGVYKALEHSAELTAIPISKGVMQDLRGRKAEEITSEELKALSKKWGVDGITLWKQKTSPSYDIVAVNSSSEEEKGLSASAWGFWFDAFKLLFQRKMADVGDGYAAENIWIGPIAVSARNGAFYKYAYYYDGSTDFMVNPWVRAEEVYKLGEGVDSDQLIEKIVKESPDIEEVSVVNIDPFLKGKDNVVANPLVDKATLYGTYNIKSSEDSKVLKGMLDNPKSSIINFDYGDKTLKRMFINLPEDRALIVTMNSTEVEKFRRQLISVLATIFVIFMVTLYLSAKIFNRNNFKELEASEERKQVAEEFKRTMELLPNAIYKLAKEDSNIKVIYNEGTTADKLGITTDKVKGRLLEEVYPSEFVADAQEAIAKAFEGTPAEFETEFNGRVYQNIVKPVTSNNSEIVGISTDITDRQQSLNTVLEVAGYATDITERKRAEEQVTFMAFHDGLTKLANRVYFNRELGKAIETAKPNEKIATMIIDLDNFKKVNDTLGHDVGDELLKAVAEKIRVSLKRKTDLAARMGGDEFTILLPQLNSHEDAAIVVERLLAEMQKPLEIAGVDLVRDFKVTMSVGISIFPDHGTDATTVFKNADVAMYAAKHGGKNGYRFFDPTK